MTQRARVLAALEAAGRYGVTQVDFLRYPAVDGGAPITRVAARVEELRRDGHRIVNAGLRDKCAIYRLESVLRAEAQRPAVSPNPVVSDEAGWTTPSLGGLSAGEHHPVSSETAAVNAIYGWDES